MGVTGGLDTLCKRNPCGVRKESAQLTLWLREIVPSSTLRKWFGHDARRWTEFRRRYWAELDANATAVEHLEAYIEWGRTTLLSRKTPRIDTLSCPPTTGTGIFADGSHFQCTGECRFQRHARTAGCLAMRLTLHTDHALRLLMLLAIEPDALQAVSTGYRISRNHLTKIAQTLALAGLIESLRGRNGGLRLARPAEAIRLGAVVRATEDSLALVECFDGERNKCVVAPACGLRGPLQEALRAFFDVFDGYSLADLVRHPRLLGRMRMLLAFPMGEARP